MTLCACGEGRCKFCRMRQWGLSRRKYTLTPEMIEELRRAYCGRKPDVTRALDTLQARTGWPRAAFKDAAAREGWTRSKCVSRWMLDELEQLREMAGRVSVRSIARKLGRTILSVQAEIARLGMSRRPQHGYNITDLAQAFGESREKIQKWMNAGLLGVVHENGGRRVAEKNVQRFIRVHPAEYDLRRVDQAWYKGLAFGRRA